MADNYTFKDASGNTVTHASEDVGSGVQASAHVSVDDAGAMIAKTEDAAHSTGDKGIMALAVRKDTAAALAGTDGDYIPLIVDSSGRLHVSDGHDAHLGSVTETAPATDTASSGLNGRLQRIAQRLTSLIGLLPASIGQKTKAESLSVVFASDQSLEVIQPSWPSTETPICKLINVSAQAAAVPIWQITAAKYANIFDVNFSTDTQMAAAIHQATLADYVAQVTADGAVHLFKCDEASGNLNDAIGPLTAVAIGTAHTYRAAAPICSDGKAIGFNGTSQAFAVASAPASCAVGAIEAWLYPTETRIAAAVALGDEATDLYHLWVGSSSAGWPYLTIRNNTVTLMSAYVAKPLPLNQWSHVVWQHDGTGLEIFVNGVPQTVTYSAGNSSTVAWYGDIVGVVDNIAIGVLKRFTNGSWWPGRLALIGWYDGYKAASVWRKHYALGWPLWGPHYFAAYTGAAAPLRAPLKTETAVSLYLSTTAAANATLQLTGVEITA